MKKAALTSEEKSSKSLIAIVDKVGVLGESLAQELSKDYLVFFASKRQLKKKNKNIFHVYYKGKIPKIPNNNYIKIFVFDDGHDITRESSFSFLAKAKDSKVPFYFITSIRNFDTKHADEIVKAYSKSCVLIFGDLFDNNLYFDKYSSITRFIAQSRKNKKIKVPASGLSLNYPISFTDTIKLIVKAAYIEMSEKTILLFAQYPITDISLANLFQKIDPEIDVDFIKSENNSEIYFPKNSQYALSKYDLKKKLSEIDLGGEEVEEFNTQVNKTDLKYFKYILFFLFAFMFLLLLPLLATYAYSFLGKKQIQSAISMSENGRFEEALIKSRNAEKFYDFAIQTSGPLVYQAELIGKEEKVYEISVKLDAGKNLSKASKSLLEGLIALEKIQTSSDDNSRRELQKSINSFKEANHIIQQSEVLGQIPEDLDNRFKKIMPLLESITLTSDLLPEILGFDKDMLYLVLMTNNLELRPGGGKIEEIGLLKIRNGKVAEFKIIDKNIFNKESSTRVEPPFAIRKYLLSDNFQIWDSNFNPDFVNSAITAASIYKIKDKVDVDGVISINLEIGKNLLLVLGPVKVNNGDSDLTQENYYETIVEKDNSNDSFVKDYVSLIGDKLNTKKSYFSIAELIGQGIINKNILFAFQNPELQNVFTSNNLSGSIVDQRSNIGSSINDFFGIREANLGNNNANYFVARSISRVLTVDSNSQLRSEVKLSFNNTSEIGKLKSETYKNYIQLVVPLGSQIQEVSVGGKRVNIISAITNPAIYERSSFVNPEDLEIEQSEVEGKSVFGFMVIIPPGSTKTITIKYALPFSLKNISSIVNYDLIINKQPGVSPYPFQQKMDLPINYSVTPDELVSREIVKDEEINFVITEKQKPR